MDHITTGEIKISCTRCNFEGLWYNGIGPAYTPEDGCHKSAIRFGWCNSCDTITKQYAGQAGIYDLSDYGIVNKYKHHGPPDKLRSFFGGKGLPWADAEWRLKELKTELSQLITENARNTGLVRRLLQGRKLKKYAERIQLYNIEVEECEESIRLYKATHKRALRDQEAANAFFGYGRHPRCLECSSHDVKIGAGEKMPHSCGTPLEFEQKTIERTSLLSVSYAYYNNDGLIVRTETKPIHQGVSRN